MARGSGLAQEVVPSGRRHVAAQTGPSAIAFYVENQPHQLRKKGGTIWVAAGVAARAWADGMVAQYQGDPSHTFRRITAEQAEELGMNTQEKIQAAARRTDRKAKSDRRQT